jgi:pimeloyl-ACP methyl ester carboxylesterase
MPSTLLEPARPPAAAPSSGRGARGRIARLERPLLLAGLALITAHLLDLSFSGAATPLLGVLAIVGLPVAWVFAQPRVTRPTRLALAVVVGLVAAGFGVTSHGLHVLNSGPDWRDVTGVAYIVGGLLLAASGLAAAVAPRRAPRRTGLAWRAAHGAGWLAGAAVILVAGVMPFAATNLTTHAPRWAISESKLGIPHEEVGIAMKDGRELSAWYVPSRNRAAVLVSHGSGGSRGRVPRHVEMLARHGYGVLALDNPGNGESDGHSNGLGDNAQPAIEAALDWLGRRPGVERGRIAGFGVSLGGEVMLEAAARDHRLAAVIADGAARPVDQAKVIDQPPAARVITAMTVLGVRAVSGMDTSRSLVESMPGIAPRPVLLVAAGRMPEEGPASRMYQRAGGPSVQVWEVPGAAHTGALRQRPDEYERRTVGFLDEALDRSG